jgi:hypothetical protein
MSNLAHLQQHLQTLERRFWPGHLLAEICFENVVGGFGQGLEQLEVEGGVCLELFGALEHELLYIAVV